MYITYAQSENIQRCPTGVYAHHDGHFTEHHDHCNIDLPRILYLLQTHLAPSLPHPPDASTVPGRWMVIVISAKAGKCHLPPSSHSLLRWPIQLRRVRGINNYLALVLSSTVLIIEYLFHREAFSFRIDSSLTFPPWSSFIFPGRHVWCPGHSFSLSFIYASSSAPSVTLISCHFEQKVLGNFKIVSSLPSSDVGMKGRMLKSVKSHVTAQLSRDTP